MFQRNRDLQRAYTNAVKKNGNKIIIHIKYAHLIHIKNAYKMCIFDMNDYYKTWFIVVCFNICVSSLKMTITPKHVGAD
jgi:hypothetical protein